MQSWGSVGRARRLKRRRNRAAIIRPLPWRLRNYLAHRSLTIRRHESWEPRRSDEDFGIPLLGFTGRIGSVVHGAESPQAAFQFLTWLASKRWSSEVLPASEATSMFRQSQVADPSPWTGPAVTSAAATEYGQILATVLHQHEAVYALRIPGEAEYMAALDDAVHAAVSGKQSPQQALDATAEKWKSITSRLGQQQQLEAYRRSLKTAQ